MFGSTKENVRIRFKGIIIISLFRNFEGGVGESERADQWVDMAVAPTPVIDTLFHTPGQ